MHNNTDTNKYKKYVDRIVDNKQVATDALKESYKKHRPLYVKYDIACIKCDVCGVWLLSCSLELINNVQFVTYKCPECGMIHRECTVKKKVGVWIMPTRIVKPKKIDDTLSLDECVQYLQQKSTKDIVDMSMLKICLQYKELIGLCRKELVYICNSEREA